MEQQNCYFVGYNNFYYIAIWPYGSCYKCWWRWKLEWGRRGFDTTGTKTIDFIFCVLVHFFLYSDSHESWLMTHDRFSRTLIILLLLLLSSSTWFSKGVYKYKVKVTVPPSIILVVLCVAWSLKVLMCTQLRNNKYISNAHGLFPNDALGIQCRDWSTNF